VKKSHGSSGGGMWGMCLEVEVRGWLICTIGGEVVVGKRFRVSERYHNKWKSKKKKRKREKGDKEQVGLLGKKRI